jgi:hypothetical protein
MQILRTVVTELPVNGLIELLPMEWPATVLIK